MRPTAPLGLRYRPPTASRYPSPTGPARSPLHSLTRPSFLLLVAAIILAALAVYGRSVAALSWFLVIVVACAAALLAVRSMLRNVAEPESLSPGGGFAGETPGELRALARSLDRARSGSVYSQTVVTARVVTAFLEKVRLTRGLSPQDMERARSDRARLRALIGDPDLADFVYAQERYSREWASRAPAAAKGSFGPTFARVLDAMEAWS